MTAIDFSMIEWFRLPAGADVDMGGYDFINVGDVDGVDISAIALDNMPAAPTGDIDAGNQNIINLADPTAAQHAATRNYVDGSSIPIGGVVAWLKDFPNTPALPDGYVECNGQVLDDEDSVYDTQTIPDLNGSIGTQRFLRGETTSGGTGGTETHTHTIPDQNKWSILELAKGAEITNAAATLPSYYEVVWIMRIK